MGVGVCYPDRYAVEETFQLLKVPWEWYVPGRAYDVVIARKVDIPHYSGNLIDLTDNDLFKQISDLLNIGQSHLHEPACDIVLDELRQELKKYTILVEILPSPWGHPYMVALTHDVDVTSVRECRFTTVGYAVFQCFLQGNLRAGLRILLAKCGFGKDPWVLFEKWKIFEEQLGVRSTFFFVPGKDDPGIQAHPYRSVGYDIQPGVLRDLIQGGWEVGVHGIDNWVDTQRGKQELAAICPDGTSGNRTHWLLFDSNSWMALEEGGYSYDSTFGYNDDAGFRAGTLQVFRPRDTKNLLELPLHIQDIGLFGKFCWAPTDNGWVKTPCLHLTKPAARMQCIRILDYARKYGGAVTLLWHYENITPPRDWSELYRDLLNHAKKDGAWVTTAGKAVEWFKVRREVAITVAHDNETISLCVVGNLPSGYLPPLMIRLYNPDNRQITLNTEYVPGKEYIDIKLDKKTVTVSYA